MKYSELSKKLKTRQKHIRIADSSPAEWKTVNEYQLCNEIADNSDDEKKIRSAENRAFRHQKQNKRFQPYGTRKTPPAAAAGSPAQLAFPGVSNSFSPFLRFISSNDSHFSTARAETNSQGGSLCRMTSVSTASQRGTGSPTVQRERPHKVNDKYTGCSNCVEGKSKTECSIKHSSKRHCKNGKTLGLFNIY